MLCLLGPRAGAAQDPPDDLSALVEDLGVAGVNVLAGGLTAALTAAIRGNDISDAFLKGVAGGAIWFAGKRVAVESFDGAAFLGREVGAVGSSIVANGGAGRGWLEQVWLPIGPVWIQVRPEADPRVRLNGLDVALALWAAGESELTLDWGRSLSNGAFVFGSNDHPILDPSRSVVGVTIGGVVVISANRLDHERVRAHEMVHVIQHDFLLHTWSRPLEAWAWERIFGWEVPVDLGLHALFIAPKLLRRLGEREAEILEFR